MLFDVSLHSRVLRYGNFMQDLRFLQYSEDAEFLEYETVSLRKCFVTF